MTETAGRRRAQDLEPDRHLIDLNGDGHYVRFRKDVHPSGFVMLRTSGEVRAITPFAQVRFMTRDHARDLIAEARW